MKKLVIVMAVVTLWVVVLATGEGTCTVPKSDRLSDNNSMAEPTKIIPATVPVELTGAHESPACSLTVLRIRK